jgi:hypothetical protein
MARLGVSAGVGYRGEVHHSDSDGDGIPELGFGFDAGPLSADLKSEALGGLWNRALNFFLGGDRPTRNVTPGERAAEQREQLADGAGDGLDDFTPQPREPIDPARWTPATPLPRAPSLMPDWSKGATGHYKEIEAPGAHYAE